MFKSSCKRLQLSDASKENETMNTIEVEYTDKTTGDVLSIQWISRAKLAKLQHLGIVIIGIDSIKVLV
jgi:hypothetical protein